MIDHLLFVESLSLGGIRMEGNPRIAMTVAQHQQADSGLGITAMVLFIFYSVVILADRLLMVEGRDTLWCMQMYDE